MDPIQKNVEITNNWLLTKLHDPKKVENLNKRYTGIFNFIRRHLKKTDFILDIGCRHGQFLELLSEKGYSNLYGVDVSPQAIEIANKKKNISAFVSDGSKMPFKTEFFDFIVCSHVLEHCGDAGLVIAEMDRLLRKKGYILIEVPIEADKEDHESGHFHFFRSLQDLYDLVTEFKIMKGEKDPNVAKRQLHYRILLKRKFFQRHFT